MDLELRLGAFGRHTRQNQDSAPKMLPRRPGRETGKQHGLASPRTPFFELLLRDLQCQTSRPEPIKKERVLQLRALASRCTLSSRLGVTPGKTRIQDRKSFPEAGPPNRETEWPGKPKDTVFWLAFNVWFSMSNVTSRTYKKGRKGFAA